MKGLLWSILFVVLILLNGRYCYAENNATIVTSVYNPVIEAWNSKQCKADFMQNRHLSFEDKVNCGIRGLTDPKYFHPLHANASVDWSKYDCAHEGTPNKRGCVVGSTKYKFLYVINYKVMSSSIHAVLDPVFEADLDIQSCQPGKNQLNVSAEEFKSFFVFTFVRNPYDRFRSAYNYYLRMERNPIRSPLCVTELMLDGFVVDGHLRSQSNNLINWENSIGGVINYNFIGRYEQFQQDWAVIEQQIFARNPLAITYRSRFESASRNTPHVNAGYRRNSREQSLSLYNAKFMSQFCRIYYQDFICLGYELPKLCLLQKE